MKRCAACGETKPLSEFSPRKAKCKPCIAEYERIRRAATKEHQRQLRKAWRKANKEKVNAERRAYYKTNREKVKASTRRYVAANWDKVRRRQHQWTKENPMASAIIKKRHHLKKSLGAQPPESLVETATLIQLIKREAKNEERK